MIIVSDTSPIHYLILIDAIEILPQVLGEIVIPEMVFAELQAEKTPEKIKSYIRRQPEWLSVRKAPNVIDPELDEIDPGERAAILLAEELSAEGLLIDDLAGRIVAAERGLRIIGTLGVLERAGKRGLIDFLDSLDRIKAAGFFISRTLEKELRSTNS